MYRIKSYISLFEYLPYSLVLILFFSLSDTIGASDSEVIIDILSARLNKFSNLIVKYEKSIEDTPSIAAISEIKKILEENKTEEMKGMTGHFATGTQTYSKEISYLNDMSLYKQDFLKFEPNIELDKLLSNDTSSRSIDNSEISLYLNDRYERLRTIRHSSGTLNNGAIENQHPFPQSDIEAALGIQIPGNDKRLKPEDLHNMDITFIDNGNVKLTYKKNSGYSYEYVFSKELGYAPILCISRNKTNQIRVQINMSEFKNVDGLMLPYKIERKSISYEDNGEKHQTQAVSITVSSYSLDDLNNIPDKYKIKWPDNTRVFDARSGVSFITTGGRLTNPNIEDIIIENMDDYTKGLETNTELTPEKEQNIQQITESIKEDKILDNSLGQTENHSTRNLIFALISLFLLAGAIMIIYKSVKKAKMET